MLSAAQALLACYGQLAERREHLLAPLLGGAAPVQWAHYPDDDVIDTISGYQYFYHSHSPEDRPDSTDHGHFHLFARVDSGVHVLDAERETHFLASLAAQAGSGNTASLLCIGLDAKGVPRSLFTVNRWVTGDHLLSADATLALLRDFCISNTGADTINTWLAAMIGLFWPQIVALLQARDSELAARRTDGVDLLDDAAVELLSSVQIDIDHQIGLLAD